MFHLTIDAFPIGGVIPDVFTCAGDNLSPALTWSEEPEGTKSFALIVDDPDAPGGTWRHWLLWDIPSGIHSLPRHYQAHSPVHTGKNDFGDAAYGGPCPPRGHGPHRYFFRLYAIDRAVLGIPAGASRKELERAIHKHQLSVAEYVGRFERK
jgi:Raf kinase inhibitor-like YbhB/YbcL family protein